MCAVVTTGSSSRNPLKQGSRERNPMRYPIMRKHPSSLQSPLHQLIAEERPRWHIFQYLQLRIRLNQEVIFPILLPPLPLPRIHSNVSWDILEWGRSYTSSKIYIMPLSNSSRSNTTPFCWCSDLNIPTWCKRFRLDPSAAAVVSNTSRVWNQVNQFFFFGAILINLRTLPSLNSFAEAPSKASDRLLKLENPDLDFSSFSAARLFFSVALEFACATLFGASRRAKAFAIWPKCNLFTWKNSCVGEWVAYARTWAVNADLASSCNYIWVNIPNKSDNTSFFPRTYLSNIICRSVATTS